jgi:predicted ABC-type ATPase
MASSNSTAGPDYQDPTILLSIIKPEKGSTPPAFGAITFDETIIQKLLSGSIIRSPEPKLIVLCGPSGSGKSTIKEKLLAEEGITNYINIDPDEIRKILREDCRVRFDFDSKEGIETMRAITTTFNKRMSDEAQSEGFNIVFDTTGQNIGAVTSLLSETKGRGYKTIFVVVWAEWETCKRRVERRNEGLPKELQLPLERAEEIYKIFENGTASKLLLKYTGSADIVLLYDNNTDNTKDDTKEVLYSRKGTTITSTDFEKDIYNMRLTASAPFITVKDAPGSSSKKGGRRRRTNRRTYRKKKRSKTKRRRFK